MSVIAGGARRLDGIPKLRGETVFTQDLKPNGLLHIKLVLSTYPSATINGVDAAAALEVPGVVAVLTNRDLAKADVAGPDQPLAGEKVYYVGQPVAAVAGDLRSGRRRRCRAGRCRLWRAALGERPLRGDEGGGAEGPPTSAPRGSTTCRSTAAATRRPRPRSSLAM